jgi:multiple sugar transport system permease protein
MNRRSGPLASASTAVFVTLATVWALFPFYWAVITSVKNRLDWFNFTYVPIPALPVIGFAPTLDWWMKELGPDGRGPELSRAMTSSVILSLGAAIVALLLGAPAGYALARFRFRRWKNPDITMWFLSQRFLPPVATIIPIFLMAKYAGLLDTRLLLIIANATFTLPFAVLILRDAFKELPLELEEAALVDGASPFGVFWRIALPLVAPAVVGAGIICFAFAWNEFFFALILTTKAAVPMTVIIAGSQESKGVIFADVATRILLAVIPPALLVLLVQRYIVRGLTFGAAKG